MTSHRRFRYVGVPQTGVTQLSASTKCLQQNHRTKRLTRGYSNKTPDKTGRKIADNKRRRGEEKRRRSRMGRIRRGGKAARGGGAGRVAGRWIWAHVLHTFYHALSVPESRIVFFLRNRCKRQATPSPVPPSAADVDGGGGGAGGERERERGERKEGRYH